MLLEFAGDAPFELSGRAVGIRDPAVSHFILTRHCGSLEAFLKFLELILNKLFRRLLRDLGSLKTRLERFSS